jgi:hypothetical protein
MSEVWLKFVMIEGDSEVKVEASYRTDYGSYHMQYVGAFYFIEVDTGANLGSVSRYWQDCYESLLLAKTDD